MKPASIAILLGPDGKVLLLRRGRTAPWRPGFWNLPGGYAEPGERPSHAARRELYEEAGLVCDLKPAGRLGHTSVFRCELAERPVVRMLDGEHDLFVWAELTDLPTPLLESTDVALRSFAYPGSDSGQELGSSMRSIMFEDDSISPDRYPQYLPYPSAIPRWMNEWSVPNENSVNWPQAQFAPKYLPPGSPSVQPYRFPDKQFAPSMYSSEVSTLGPSRQAVPVQNDPALVPQDMSEPQLNYGGCGPDCDCAPCKATHNPDPADWASTLRIISMLAAPVAMGVSYSRNKSLFWAALSGFVGPAYLVYVGAESLGKKD